MSFSAVSRRLVFSGDPIPHHPEFPGPWPVLPSLSCPFPPTAPLSWPGTCSALHLRSQGSRGVAAVGAEKCQPGLLLELQWSGLAGDIWRNTGSWALRRGQKAGPGGWFVGTPEGTSPHPGRSVGGKGCSCKCQDQATTPRVGLEDLEGFMRQECFPGCFQMEPPLPRDSQGLRLSHGCNPQCPR